MHATHKVTAREMGNREKREKESGGRGELLASGLAADTERGKRLPAQERARKARYKVLMLAGDGRRGTCHVV